MGNELKHGTSREVYIKCRRKHKKEGVMTPCQKCYEWASKKLKSQKTGTGALKCNVCGNQLARHKSFQMCEKENRSLTRG